LIGSVFGVLLSDRDINGIGLAMGTAVIGAGAVLLPGGAAGSASARILAALPGGSADPQVAAVKTLEPDPAQAGVPDVARLRGTLTSPAGADAWFEYGDAPDTLGTRTAEQKVPGGTDVPATGDASAAGIRSVDRHYRLVARLPNGTELAGDVMQLPKV